MPLPAGKLRHRVTLQQKVETRDTYGGLSIAWETVAESVPAQISYLSARELIASQSMKSEIVARVVIRARDDIDPTMRLLYGNLVFNIQGILPDLESGREYFTIPVSQGVNDGR